VCLCSGCRVSLWRDKKFWKYGDGCAILQMYGMASGRVPVSHTAILATWETQIRRLEV
jgi:uncharacterized protein (DUF2236 family)